MCGRLEVVAKALDSYLIDPGSNTGCTKLDLLTFYAIFSHFLNFWPQISPCAHGGILEIFEYVNKLTKIFHLSQKNSW